VPYDIRPIAPDEAGAFYRADAAAFGYGKVTDAMVETWRPSLEVDRTLAAFEGEAVVGTAGAFSFELTLPGLTTVPVAAVSFVSVLPTHRRQGLLTALMALQLHDVHERGEPVAVLTASEGAIYGRFGYGVATVSAEHTLERARATMRRDRASGPGTVRLVDEAEALKLIPAVHDGWRRTQPGEVSRTPGFWEVAVAEDPLDEQKGSWFRAVHEGPGGPDAYAAYRVEPDWHHELASSRLTVDELCAVDAGAEAAMFSFLCGVDLVTQIRFENRPLDDPLRWALADPRQLACVRTRDWMWVRPVDAAAALAARRYRVADRLTVDLADEVCPWNAGRWVVEGGPDGATARPARSGEEPDLALGAPELGSVLLGGVVASALARAGRIHELTPGALDRADLFLGANRPPWTMTAF
jgi:predicted acetyltransferase